MIVQGRIPGQYLGGHGPAQIVFLLGGELGLRLTDIFRVALGQIKGSVSYILHLATGEHANRHQQRR